MVGLPFSGDPMRTVLGLLALLVPVASFAEPVTYHLTGTVYQVSDGSTNTLDLRGSFTVGSAITLDLTVERSTVPFVADPNTFIYEDTGTSVAFTIGGYACTGAASAVITIENDLHGLDHFSYSA